MVAEHVRKWPNRLPIWFLKFLLNIYPPYWGTGIYTQTIAPDFRFVEVTMKLHWYNKNYVGTHFGGSMFAMTDPFFMLMLIRNLGPDYIVWDKAGFIEFKKPGYGKLSATFYYTEEEIENVRIQVAAHSKWVFDRSVDLRNEAGEVVATVVKTLYVTKKKSA